MSNLTHARDKSNGISVTFSVYCHPAVEFDADEGRSTAELCFHRYARREVPVSRVSVLENAEELNLMSHPCVQL